MGRGLSGIQKRIIVLALLNAGAEEREDHYADRPHLYTKEVMVSIYKLDAGFVPIAESLDMSPNAIWRTDRPVRDRRGWVFERERFYGAGNEGRIQVEVYNAAISAISRAFERLEKRGLVKRRRRSVNAGAGIVLTPAGYQEALAHLKEIDPDRHQRVISLLKRSSNG